MLGCLPIVLLAEKMEFFCDVGLKSKKIQIAQIFKLSFRSLKNQETAKILLCDCSPNFSAESLATDDITTPDPTSKMLDT
jgi:hypothetical protein